MKILFLHGWTSVPGGRKPTFLASHGHTVLNYRTSEDEADGSMQRYRMLAVVNHNQNSGFSH